MTAVKAAAFYRVSTLDQQAANQVPDVEQFAAHRGYEIAATYTVSDSAWHQGDGYQAELARLLQDAHEGRFSVAIVWAADRLTRGGIEDLLRVIRLLRERGVTLVSVKEPWLDGTNPAVAELLAAIVAWIAQQESARRSERVKAGLARRKAGGKPVGRQPGSRDRKPRKRSGYVAAWEDGGARRAAT